MIEFVKGKARGPLSEAPRNALLRSALLRSAKLYCAALCSALLRYGMLGYGPILHDETPVLRPPATETDALASGLQCRMHVFLAH